MGYFDNMTLGRYAAPSRVRQRDNGDGSFTERTDSSPLFYWFDGKAVSPVKRSRALEAFTGLGITTLAQRGQLRYTDYDFAQAFLASEFAYRCIQTVASDVDGIKHGVRVKGTKTDAPDHPLQRAITYARLMYQQNLINLWQKSLGVWGETFIWPQRNLYGYYSGLRWLNPMVTEPRTEYGVISGYDYRVGGIWFFEPHELIFDKVDNLLDDLRGQSKIAVALDAINIDREIKRYTLDTLIKDMRMAGILTGRPGSYISQTELDDALLKLKEQRQSRLIALAPPLEYQKVQQEIDGSQLQLSEDARRRIAAALGIPMSVAGAWDSATFQSAPEQVRFYYENVIFRECERHARVMNEIVMPFFDNSGQYEFYYDTDAAQTRLEDKQAKVSMINSRVTGGTMTINQARTALGDEPIMGGDALLIPTGYTLVPVDQLAEVAARQAAALTVAAPAAAPALPAPTTQAAIDAVTPVPQPEPAPTEGIKSLCLMLKLGAQPDLIALQGRVKQLLADGEVVWNEPDDFHVTLIYAPSVTDVQLAGLTAALDGIEPPEMKLRVGSLRTFDNLGEYAVHFAIRRNTDLLDFQEAVYDLFEQAGIAMSAYSQPEQYKPHITVGYSKVKPRAVMFEGKLTVTPIALELAADETTVWAWTPDPVDIEAQIEARRKAVLDEVDAWEKKARNKGATAPFKNYLIYDELADGIREELAKAGDSKAAIKSVFEMVRQAYRHKAIQSTRIEFEDAFDDLMAAAMRGDINRRTFSARLRQLISTYSNHAYRDGLAEGGVMDEPDEGEQEAIATHVRAQSEFVSALGTVLYKDETTPSQSVLDQKAAMWFTRSVMPMYFAGFSSANGNQLMEFTGDDGAESCPDCQRMKGQRHRLKDWIRKQLQPGIDGHNFECGGWQCKHLLVPVSGKAKGNW